MDILKLGQYFYRLAEKSQDVFWISDAHYKERLYVNPSYEKIWGITSESLYANPDVWHSLIHPDDLQEYLQKINEIKTNFNQKTSYLQEYRLICADKQTKRIQEVCFPLLGANQELIGFAGTAKDVTEEKQYLAEVEKSIHYFKFFAEKIRAVFWVHEHSPARQIYISPGYEKIWGRSRESLYSNPDSWEETIHPEDRKFAGYYTQLHRFEDQENDEPCEVRFRILRPDGSVRWIKDTSFVIRDENPYFIGFAEDITKEVLHEQEIQEAKHRAETANQAKSDFLAMTSHELRTPLNAILGMSEILKSKPLSKELLEYVDIITNAGNSLLLLVNDILDFARLEVGKLTFVNEPFDLKRLFKQLVKSMQYLAQEKNIELTLDYAAGPLDQVVGDAHRVQQVVLNLLSNALKFTNQGSIKVEVKALSSNATDTVFEIKVTDTGVGISEEYTSSIFDKFSQIDPVYHRKQGGIGLGLAITKSLVTAMGGEIGVKSECGKGSEFRLTLVLKNQSSQNQVVSESENTQQGNGCALLPRKQYHFNILLVEDNPINRKIATIMLEDFGCKVTTVNNGYQALEKIENNDSYDLVFMDIGLPDMSGFAIVRKIRQELLLNEIPIIAMTAHVLERDKEQAYAAGMNKILAKPISYDEIEVVLQSYLY